VNSEATSYHSPQSQAGITCTQVQPTLSTSSVQLPISCDKTVRSCTFTTGDHSSSTSISSRGYVFLSLLPETSALRVTVSIVKYVQMYTVDSRETVLMCLSLRDSTVYLHRMIVRIV